MINLKIDPEFQSQIPPLTDDEFKQLEENILKEGKLLSPLIVWNNTLVDGHNRYAILQKHPEIYFSTMPLRFENREEAVAWICRNQLGRRNLSPEQKRYLLGKQYEAEKKAAKRPAAFEEQHRAELTAHRAAAAYFKANDITKLPSPKKLEAEYAQLASEKAKFYEQYKETKEELLKLKTAKQNVASFFREEEPAQQER